MGKKPNGLKGVDLTRSRSNRTHRAHRALHSDRQLDLFLPPAPTAIEGQTGSPDTPSSRPVRRVESSEDSGKIPSSQDCRNLSPSSRRTEQDALPVTNIRLSAASLLILRDLLRDLHERIHGTLPETGAGAEDSPDDRVSAGVTEHVPHPLREADHSDGHDRAHTSDGPEGDCADTGALGGTDGPGSDPPKPTTNRGG